jgi:tetratricopeptide (TPR) repeat protein
MLISLCMIVKDEEEMLPGCLDSVRDAVDEMVIVDTGSSDRTVELAEAAGARVVYRAWDDDFAAARNAALPELQGRWILHLDADERLAPGAAATLRAVAQRSDLDCGMLPLHDATHLGASPADVLSGAARSGSPHPLPRLYRRSPDFCWEGVVHESPTTWMAREGRVIEMVDAPLVHYGAIDAYREQKGKAQRNLRLLEKRCEQDPGDAVARGYLSRELIRAGDVPRARSEVERAWDSLVAAYEGRGSGRRPAAVQVASIRAYLALLASDHSKVIETADRCLAFGVEHPNLRGMRAMSVRRQCQDLPPAQRGPLLEGVVRDLRWCLSGADTQFGEEVMAGITGAAGATELGVALLLGGRPQEALPAFRQALAEDPEMRAARIGVVEALLDAGQSEEALAELQSLLPEGGADEWALAACICLAVGAGDDAATFLSTALSHGKPGADASYRVERFVALAAAFEPAT